MRHLRLEVLLELLGLLGEGIVVLEVQIRAAAEKGYGEDIQ